MKKTLLNMMVVYLSSSREEKGEKSTRKGVTENKPSPLKICVGEDKE